MIKKLGMETQLLQMQTVEALQIAVKGRIVWKGNIKSLSEGSLIYVPFSIAKSPYTGQKKK
jgi:predicted metal-binding protein